MQGGGFRATYRSAPQVRQRYGGISDMTLYRWLRDDKLSFPQPIYIQTRRYWRQDALEAWEPTQAGAIALGPRPPSTDGEQEVAA